MSVQKFLKFVDASPSPFHAVHELKSLFVAAGFRELKETDSWAVENGHKYFFTRNGSTIVAFAVGKKYQPGNGFAIVGAHTDSPCLKIKPRSKISSDGYLQVGSECYGGGMWMTWFDRDLTAAGRVMVKNGDKFEHRLCNLKKPILRIPNLAIHLNREVNTKFEFNKDDQLKPILCAAVDGGEDSDPKHHSKLMKMMADDLGVKVEDVHDFEMCLADTQESALGGPDGEYILAPRLDNLFNAYTASEALIQSSDLENEESVRLVCCFDNEEVGSRSSHGANSNILESVLKRLTSASKDPQAYDTCIMKSFHLSMDQAHSVHPNYKPKHEQNHRPVINGGIVLKFNANQSYATTAATSLLLKEAAKLAKQPCPLQEVCVRNDTPCGSTIGPILASRMGLRTVDVGAAQLSMHSIREMGGAKDVEHNINLSKSFYENYTKLNKSIIVD